MFISIEYNLVHTYLELHAAIMHICFNLIHCPKFYNIVISHGIVNVGHQRKHVRLHTGYSSFSKY